MKMFKKCFDGGPESTVTAYVLIEIKSLFSIKLLKFNKGSRENFHSHAFNALTWFLKGRMTEHFLDGTTSQYKRSLKPKLTPRGLVHKVFAHKTSWCLTFRGPWCREWDEYTPDKKQRITLTHGRNITSVEHL